MKQGGKAAAVLMGEVGAETDLVFGELASLDRALDDDGYDARGSAWNGVLELDDEKLVEDAALPLAVFYAGDARAVL